MTKWAHIENIVILLIIAAGIVHTGSWTWILWAVFLNSSVSVRSETYKNKEEGESNE